MTSFLDRLLGRQEPARAKAVTALGPWATGIPLSLYQTEPQEKAAAYLKAYKVGWFYKAGSKIARDVSRLDWTVADGDAEEGDQEATLDRPPTSAKFDSLKPIDQFQRLLETPVVDPSGRVLLTGRALLHKTEVHLDFTGNACWYLENGNGTSLPTAIMPISPARMTPSRNKQGRLIGWVLDADAPSGGTPFDLDEILWFNNGGTDDDVWGTSVVEAVYSQVPLTDLMARHTGNVLALGGRLSGMLWPKERSLTEDEFVDAQRAWRNVASDPNAAKRLLIFPEPMEWSQGAATPDQIGIPELAMLNRDEILTAFPVSPYMLGVPTPGGLNSGEVRREDRRDYWEGTIDPRADLIEETVQVGLLNRYEAVMGLTYNFELNIPQLDDAPSLMEKAAALQALINVGFDPKETIEAVGLDHIKWVALPAEADPAKRAEMAERSLAADEAKKQGGTTTVVNDSTRRDNTQTQTTLGKAREDYEARATKAREDVAEKASLVLSDFLDGQRERVVDALRRALPKEKAARKASIKADPDWWNAAAEDAELSATLRVVYGEAAQQGLQVVANELDRVIPNKAISRITADLLTYGGERIRDINARTLQAITLELAEGTRRGYTIAQLIDGVEAENFKGVLNVGLDNGVGVWGDARAETIARTETALSYNRAALGGYREFNVKQVTAIDGDHDEQCANRNGQTFSVDDAFGIADHPNGTLDWVPVIPEKAAHLEPAAPVVNVNMDLHVPEQVLIKAATPEVNVTVEPTPVTVEPIIKVPPVIVPKIELPQIVVPDPIVINNTASKAAPAVQDVRLVESLLPPKKRKVKRDQMGRVTEITEE